VQPPSPAIAARVQQIREDLASIAIYTASRKYERALEVGRAAVDAATALDYAPLQAEALRRHGETRSERGEYDAAAESLERAFYLAHEASHDDESARAAADLYFLHGYRKGDPEAAEIWRGHAEAAVQRLGDAGAAANAKFVQVSGAVALRQADYVRARELLTEGRRLAIELHGEDHLQVASLSGNLGVAELNRGDFEAARRHFEAAVAVTEKNYGPDHPEIASWYNNLGVLEQTRGNHEASLEWFRKSYDVESAIFGEKHPGVALGLNNIGGALAYLERNEEARDYFERAIAAYEAVDGYDPIDLARAVGNLGRTLHHLGDPEGGAERLRRAIQLIEESAGPEHPELSTMFVNLGSIYQNAGRLHEALELMERAVAIDRDALGERHPFVGSSLASIGEVYLALGRRAEALASLGEALEIQSAGEGDPENLAATKVLLARALWTDPAERTRARVLLTEAERELESIGPVAADRLIDLRSWLSTLD
jgi:tetratricopeptide (TPR) repeat protein